MQKNGSRAPSDPKAFTFGGVDSGPTRLTVEGGKVEKPHIIALQDLWETLESLPLLQRLVFQDIRSRYRRTLLGPFWTVANVAILVAVLGVAMGVLWGRPLQEFLPFFAAGYVTWVFITSTMNEHASAFISSANTIRSLRAPLTLHVFRVLSKNFILLLHTLPVFIIAALVFQYPFPAFGPVLLAPVGILLLLMNLLWFGLFTAVLCTRYRDFLQILQAVLQGAFFLTPIFWPKDQLADNELGEFILMNLNPFFHLVDVVRAPLIGEIPSMLTYIVLAIAALVGPMFSLAVLGVFRSRIAYWV